MSLKERIYSVLVVSVSDSFNTAAAQMLPSSQYQPVCIAASVSEAKRYIAAREFDFVIINSPLPDESGTPFRNRLLPLPNDGSADALQK